VNILYSGITISNVLEPELFVYIINVCSSVQGSRNWTKVFRFDHILEEIIDALSRPGVELAFSGLPGMAVSLFLFRNLLDRCMDLLFSSDMYLKNFFRF
jgi:hypothetical protein